MYFNFKRFSYPISLSLLASLTLGFLPSQEASAVEQAPVPGEVPQEAAPTLDFPDLQKLGKNYRVNPTSESWQNYINALKKHLAEPYASKSAGSKIIKANPSLKDLRVKLINVGGGRIWYFPNNTKNQIAYLQVGQSINEIKYPDSINISDAKLIRSVITTTKTVRVRRRRRTVRVRKKVVKVSGPKFLVIAGTNRLNGKIWLSAFKPYDGSWVKTVNPFKDIPPYILKNVSGNVQFSGNNIVMSVSTPDSIAKSKLPKPNSTSYRIVLKESGGTFHLQGSSNANQPVSIITQFVNGIRNNRLDLAKAWLHDPTLISIPKYVGLIGKSEDKPYKLVAMAHPKSGGPRYRLVTYRKHDLIFDIGSRYGRLAIRGIFIAPPDPLAKQLNGTIIGARPTPPENSSESKKTN